MFSNDVSFFSMVTREDDPVFSSFVNCVVVAPTHAQEIGVTKERSRDMPLISIFGTRFSWALRDAIAYSGTYDDVYSKNFGGVSEVERGRNSLNKGGAQVHSFPGLSP